MRCTSNLRPAFALPMVIILMLVGSLAITVMLERQHLANSLVARQTNTYRDHHRAAGVKELVSAWQNSARAGVRGALDEDGFAFQLERRGGRPIRVYVFAAQGGLLRDPSSAGGEAAERARLALELLALSVPPEVLETSGTEFLREYGPVQVSVNSAPMEVLTAVFQATVEDENALELAGAIIEARQEEPIDPAGLRQLLREQELNVAEVSRVLSLLTAEEVIWRVEAEFPESHLDRFGRRWTVVREGGLIRLTDGGDLFSSSSSFLTWGPLEER